MAGDHRGGTPPSRTRRQFVRGGVLGGGVAIGATGIGRAQEDDGEREVPDFGSYLQGARGGSIEDHRGESSVTVEVGGADGFAFLPTGIWIDEGAEVTFEWVSDNHNVVVDSQPEEGSWEGSPGPASETYNDGYRFSSTFETGGIYEYYCLPHEPQGMVGAIAVGDDVPTERVGGGGGCTEDDLHACGVPIQAHFVGLATILMLVVTMAFTFYLLKHGESPHSKGGD